MALLKVYPEPNLAPSAPPTGLASAAAPTDQRKDTIGIDVLPTTKDNIRFRGQLFHYLDDLTVPDDVPVLGADLRPSEPDRVAELDAHVQPDVPDGNDGFGQPRPGVHPDDRTRRQFDRTEVRHELPVHLPGQGPAEQAAGHRTDAVQRLQRQPVSVELHRPDLRRQRQPDEDPSRTTRSSSASSSSAPARTTTTRSTCRAFPAARTTRTAASSSATSRPGGSGVAARRCRTRPVHQLRRDRHPLLHSLPRPHVRMVRAGRVEGHPEAEDHATACATPSCSRTTACGTT